VGGAWVASLVGGLLFVATVPRLLARGLRPGTLQPMYGLQYLLMRLVRGLSNVPLYNQWLGDSSVIVHYLSAIGQHLPQLQQTGSNFGLAQQHDVPGLCTYGSGTMVSDGLIMVNADAGARGFRLHPVALGARSFLGNGVLVPPGHRLGDDCLLATKVMVPVGGVRREGVGLLGSPAFVIPRSVARDRALLAADGLDDPPRRRRALAAKNRANARVMAAWVAVHGGLFLLLALLWHEAYPRLSGHGGWFAAGFAALSLPLSLAWLLVVDALSRGLRRLQPMQVSILDPRFWRHERHWKLGLAADHPLVQVLNGTPFKAWIWRLAGVQVGRRLFDDGCAMPEKTLVRIGDDCTLGAHATLQGHSLEDGVFKSGRLWLGDGVSVGANAYVHYDTRLADGAQVAPDSFVMKGEQLGAGTRWQGNPAQALG
jgi:non-ribosomal peptide synthetase-like protein